MSRQLALFFTAAQFLTRLPTPAVRDFDPSSLSRSVRYFPLVGVLIGLVNVGAWGLSSLRLPASVSIGLMLAVSAVLTGALHEDGFADACDGFGGGTTPDRVLAIMKDSRIGAYGAIGIVMMLGLKWSTLNAMPAVSLPLLVVSAHMVSRWCATALIWRLPYVRVEADAKAKPFAHGQGGGDWLLSGVIGLVALCVVAVCVAGVLGVPLLEHDAVAAGALPLRACGTALLTAAVITLLAGVYIRQRIGGYTGDCLGAVQQLSELGFLMTGLAVLGHS